MTAPRQSTTRNFLDDWEELFDHLRGIALGRYGRRAKRFALELDDGEVVWTPIPTFSQVERRRAEGQAVHGPGFRSVVWFGQEYSFTPKQADAVAILWDAWSQDTPDVEQNYILREIASDCTRLQDIFKRNAAWGTMIRPGDQPGTYRLVPPERE